MLTLWSSKDDQGTHTAAIHHQRRLTLHPPPWVLFICLPPQARAASRPVKAAQIIPVIDPGERSHFECPA